VGTIEVFDVAKDELILAASDRTFGEGYIGFGSISDNGRVRNLKVWAAGATAGPPGFLQRKP
jgi:hypothetical protein